MIPLWQFLTAIGLAAAALVLAAVCIGIAIRPQRPMRVTINRRKKAKADPMPAAGSASGGYLAMPATAPAQIVVESETVRLEASQAPTIRVGDSNPGLVRKRAARCLLCGGDWPEVTQCPVVPA